MPVNSAGKKANEKRRLRMPRRKASKPAKDTVDVAIGGSGSGPSNPGFGPNGPGARNPLTSRGSGGFKSSHPHVVPKTWVRGEVAEDFNLPEEV
jgi:hypothetical protein